MELGAPPRSARAVSIEDVVEAVRQARETLGTEGISEHCTCTPSLGPCTCRTGQVRSTRGWYSTVLGIVRQVRAIAQEEVTALD